MYLLGWFRWTAVVIPMLLVLASGRQLPQRHEKRAVPESKNPVNDPYVEFWKQHNHELCPMGMVSQRNNTVCCLPTSCKPGYGIEACSVHGSEDVCIPCNDGYVQRLNVSSLNMTNTACFKELENHKKCPLDDFHAVEIGRYSDMLPFSCECALERCHWPEKGYKGAGSCKTENDCPAHYQLNKLTGVCEPCPWYADKDQPGCWPCVINVTLLRLGRPDINTRVRIITTPSTTTTLSQTSPVVNNDNTSPNSKSEGNERLSGFPTIPVAVVSVVSVLLIAIVGFFCLCRRGASSNIHVCQQVWEKLSGCFSTDPTQGSSNDLLSTQISPPTTPTSYYGNRNLVDISPSPSPITDFILSEAADRQSREAQSRHIESRPMVLNYTNVPLPRRDFLVNQGQINGVNSFMGQNECNSSPVNSDAELEPLLPLTPDETQPKSRLYPDISALINTPGSTSYHREAALRQSEEFNRIYQTLNSENSMLEDTMGVTAHSTASELVVPEAHSSDGTISAALSDNVSTNRTKDLKAIGVQPSPEETVQKSRFSSGEQCYNKKCKGNNNDNGDDNPKAGGSTINFNGPINNSVININIENGAVRIGGEELSQRKVQTLQGRAAAGRVPCYTSHEAHNPASSVPFNNINKGISEFPSQCENVESGEAFSKELLYNISVVKKDNISLSDKVSDEDNANEASADSSSLDDDNKVKMAEVLPPVNVVRPFVRVAPLVHVTNERQNISQRYRSNAAAHSNISSGYGLAHMSEPFSRTSHNAWNSEESEATTDSRQLPFPRNTLSTRANAGSMSPLTPSTALQMERLKEWEHASETVPKTVDYDEEERGTTLMPQGLQVSHDPDQTDRKEAADDGHSNEQTEVKGLAGLDED